MDDPTIEYLAMDLAAMFTLVLPTAEIEALESLLSDRRQK